MKTLLRLATFFIPIVLVVAATQEQAKPTFLSVIDFDEAYKFTECMEDDKAKECSLPHGLTVEYTGDFIHHPQRAVLLQAETVERLKASDQSAIHDAYLAVKAAQKESNPPPGYVRCGSCASFAKRASCESIVSTSSCDMER